jgi:hypothetical protein
MTKALNLDAANSALALTLLGFASLRLVLAS